MGRGRERSEGTGSAAELVPTPTRAEKKRRSREEPARPKTKRKKASEETLPPEVFSTLTKQRLAEAPTLPPLQVPAVPDPEPRTPTRGKSLAGIAALAVGLLGGVAVLIAVTGRGGAPASTAAAVQATREAQDERGRQLASAAEAGDARAMVELARHLSSQDPSPEQLQQAIAWAGRVKQATSDAGLLEEAGDLEARLLGEARQRAIASRNEAEADAQAAWEKDAPRRKAAEAAWAKEEERSRLQGRLEKVEALLGREANGQTVGQAEKLLVELRVAAAGDAQLEAALQGLVTRLGVARDRLVEQALAAARVRMEAGDPAACLTELAALAGLEQLPPEVEAVRKQAETAVALAAATKRQEAEAADAKSRAAAAAELSQAKEALIARQKAAAAIEVELRARAQDWYEARDPRELTCSECKGVKEVEHKACKGTQWGKCGNCSGSGRVISVGPGGGDFSCGTCGGSGKLRCGRCTLGKVTCGCCEDYAGALAGYRAQGGQRAFWEFTSPLSRKGKRRQDHFAAVVRGLELQDQLGHQVQVAAARIESVWVQDDKAEVRARVRWMRPWGPSSEVLHLTQWIREGGKLWLATPGSEPERLLPELTAAQRKALKLPDVDPAPRLPDLPTIPEDDEPRPVVSAPAPRPAPPAPTPAPTPPTPPQPTPPTNGKPAAPTPPPAPPTKLDAQPAKPEAPAEPKEDMKLVEAEAKALLADPALQKKLAAVQEEARKRAESWLESREEKELRCKECEGLALVTDPRCRGTQRMPCRTCNGDGSVVTRQRGKQHRVTCSTCQGETTEPCIAPCKDGRIDCPACVKEGVPGFRPLAGKHAFWDFLSAAARKGRKAPELFRDVVEGRAMAAARGRSVAISRGAVKSVQVLKNRVVITAEVEWASAPGSSDLLVTTWVREKDRLYLLQPGDALVPLLE